MKKYEGIERTQVIYRQKISKVGCSICAQVCPVNAIKRSEVEQGEVAMKNKNLILAGVGGQGLVLTTQIISQAAFLSGLDVKTNDVIGLSQRGGTIWGEC